MKTSVIVLGEDHTKPIMRKILVNLQTILEEGGIRYSIGYEGCSDESHPQKLIDEINQVHSWYEKNLTKQDIKFFKFNHTYLDGLQKHEKAFPIDDKVTPYERQKNSLMFKLQTMLSSRSYADACTTNFGVQMRDKSMADKTLLEARRQEKDIIILLCGADHISGVCEELKKNGIIFTSATSEDVSANYKIKANDNMNIRGVCSYILNNHNEKVQRSSKFI